MSFPCTNFNYFIFTLLFFLYINVNNFKPTMGENKQNQRYYDNTITLKRMQSLTLNIKLASTVNKVIL